jgi:tRNA G37 N-methylase Trm5
MGYFDSYAFLPIAIEALTNGGTIHFHALSPKSKIEEKCSKIKNIVEDFGFDSQISVRTVKSYAPLIWHVVFDIRL